MFLMHKTRHRLIERLEVRWRDVPPNFEGDSFQTFFLIYRAPVPKIDYTDFKKRHILM